MERRSCERIASHKDSIPAIETGDGDGRQRRYGRFRWLRTGSPRNEGLCFAPSSSSSAHLTGRWCSLQPVFLTERSRYDCRICFWSEASWLQDRLVKELRLASVSNIEAGNDFLPRFVQSFNERFAVCAAKPEDLHRKLALASSRMSDILCHREQRSACCPGSGSLRLTSLGTRGKSVERL